MRQSLKRPKGHSHPIYRFAPLLERQVESVVGKLGFTHVIPEKVTCIVSQGSKTRAVARIWSFPRIWQLALSLPPCYVIEFISERFDKLDQDQKTKVIIHELLHIPKSFSGALVPHRNRGETIGQRRVEKIYSQLKAK